MIDVNFLDYFFKIRGRKEIPAFLKKFSLNNLIVEIGVRNGRHFKVLLQADPKTIYGIDIWLDDGILDHNFGSYPQAILDNFYNNMKKMEAIDKRIKIIRDWSLNAVKDFEDNFFDYVYIDGDHSYDSVYQDMRQWYRKVKIGGILAGHDYLNNPKRAKVWHVEGVKKAVDEYVKENNPKYFHLTLERCPSWLIIKNT